MKAFNKLVDMSITGGLFVMTSLAYLQGLLFALLVIAVVTSVAWA